MDTDPFDHIRSHIQQLKGRFENMEFKMTNVLPDGRLQRVYSCKLCSYSSTIDHMDEHLKARHFKKNNPTLNMFKDDEDQNVAADAASKELFSTTGTPPVMGRESLTGIDQFLQFHDRVVTKSGKIHKSYKCIICGHIARSDNIKQHVRNKHFK